MALSKNVNSYVTVDEANSYFADRLDVAAWEQASDTQKAQALVTATALLDNLTWDGFAVSDTQLLAFPRIISYFDPRLGRQVNTDTTPTRILTATYELSYHLLNNDGLLDNTGLVENLQLGPINLTNIRNASVIPLHVKRIFQPLLINKGAFNVWRAW